MSESAKRRIRHARSEETKRKIRDALVGRTLSDCHRDKMKGKRTPRSEETNKKCREKWNLIKEQRKKSKQWLSREEYDALPYEDMEVF